MTSLQSRIAGAAGLVFVLTAFLGTSGPFFDDPSRAEMLAWVRDHPHALGLAGLQIMLTPVLVGIVVMALVARTGRRGPWAVFALVCLVANAAVDQVSAAISWALAEAGRQQGAGDAVVALFSLSKEMTFADGFLFGLAAVSACLLSLRARTLPAPLIWLGFLVGVIRVLGTSVDVLGTGRPEGPDGPVGLILVLLWLVACSVVLIVRPAPPRPTDGEATELQVSGTNR